MWLRGMEGRPPILLSMFTSHDFPGFKHRVVALCFAGAGAPVLRRGVPQSATQSCSGHPPILLSIGGRSAIDFLSFPAPGTREGRKEKQGKGGRKEGRKEGNWTSSIPNGRCHFGVRALLFPTHATPFPPTCSSCRPGPVLLHSHGEAYDARDGCSG
jgi:hypothetical protein